MKHLDIAQDQHHDIDDVGHPLNFNILFVQLGLLGVVLEHVIIF